MAQAIVAHCLSWSEFFPGLDGGDSKVAGLMEAAVRSPENCSFNETPHIGHQGGSSIALSKYSKNPDAAWLLMQWVTSKDAVALALQLHISAISESISFDDLEVVDDGRIVRRDICVLGMVAG